tara:strand:+ start:13846 stop:14250 length:405 start_codon:yes stop_codon:yes gene_type:complete
MAKRKRSSKRATALKHGFRSGLEEDIDNILKQVGVDGEYEQNKILYIKPETNHTYTPDFRLPNGVYIETKGRFVLADRQKHILIKKQHPELDIRFIFQNARNKIRKGSKTTYGDWCIKHGFIYSDKIIPPEWFD